MTISYNWQYLLLCDSSKCSIVWHNWFVALLIRYFGSACLYYDIYFRSIQFVFHFNIFSVIVMFARSCLKLRTLIVVPSCALYHLFLTLRHVKLIVHDCYVSLYETLLSCFSFIILVICLYQIAFIYHQISNIDYEC